MVLFVYLWKILVDNFPAFWKFVSIFLDSAKIDILESERFCLSPADNDRPFIKLVLLSIIGMLFTLFS
jgi:hypothetical protein